MQGKLRIILGPMSSGKTKHLLWEMDRGYYANLMCAYVAHSLDKKRLENESTVFTHDGVVAKRHYKVIKADTIESIFDTLMLYDKIAIDEGQFFPDLNRVKHLVEYYNKDVIVAGLDGDFNRNAFPTDDATFDVLSLIPYCNSVEKINAVCQICKHFGFAPESALFSLRLSRAEAVVDIGAEDKYVPACRRCYRRMRKLMDHYTDVNFQDKSLDLKEMYYTMEL